MKSSEKYIELWTGYRESIKAELSKATNEPLQLNAAEFRNVGNRKDYSFNLEFIDGNVSNNISGTAVARDLAKVLLDSYKVNEVLKSGHFKIRMDKEFCLWISRKH